MKLVPVPGTDVLMCIHETRMKDYAAFAAASPSRTSTAWQNPSQSNVPVGTGDDHPVVNILWDEAQAFCEWLTTKEGRKYRLPTDREWSFAVGIGDQEDGNLPPSQLSAKIAGVYPWGKAWPPPKGAGNLADDSMKEKFPTRGSVQGYADGFPTTSPVMSFEPNTLGIYDLAGNVWDWCDDGRGHAGRMRVVRGGSWFTERLPEMLSSGRGLASVRTPDRGFRIVAEKEK
jgi:formylglycine-generating enzyme required for sulfatase activity